MDWYNLEGQDFCGWWLPVARAWCAKNPGHLGNHAARVRTRIYCREVQRTWSIGNRERIRGYNWKTRQESPRYKLLAAWKLERGCERCGYCEDARALDLDHRDPALKVVNVSAMISLTGRYTDEQFVDELLKCRVLCKNCHAIKTCEDGDQGAGRRRVKRVLNGTETPQSDQRGTDHHNSDPGG